MGASTFVGRVGGLAVALGVGSAWFAIGTASADTGSESAPNTRAQTTQSRDVAARSAHQARSTARTAAKAVAARPDTRRVAAATPAAQLTAWSQARQTWTALEQSVAARASCKCRKASPSTRNSLPASCS